jgi:hypothetical protein
MVMRVLVAAVAAALLFTAAGSAAPPDPQASTATARCAKGQERVKLRVGGRSKSRCVKKCKAGFVRKFTNRRSKATCARKPVTPAAPGSDPGPAATPAPGATTEPVATPTPAPVDNRERARALLRHRVLSYYKGSSDYSSSTQKSVTLCGDGAFAYFYRYDSSGSAGSVGNETRANGTWDVDEAEFNDAAGAMRAIVSWKSNDQSSLQDGRMLVEAMGEKVWVDGDEWGYATANC